MMEVRLSPAAHDEAMQLTASARTRVLVLIERLAQWPRVSGAKRLTGQWAGCFRLRTGDYRVIFRLEDGAVRVLKIGHRKDIYED